MTPQADEHMRTYARYPDGAIVALCGSEHAQNWLLASLVDDGCDLYDQVLSPKATCSHCGWCGVLTSRPTSCRIHTHCPSYDARGTMAWKVTHYELTLAAAAAGGSADLPPRALAYLDAAADQLAACGKLTAKRLFAAVWDKRVDWLR